ncbi:adenylyl-sulfate kinase [Streptomyces fulvorobeus]|uniref:Adenylyl-sulfate kinase n=1 Tax=Streptomyces fulvorobeus TaxID=284028 RepID=A0A7J0CDR7_9ACTN|nr:adenylyl-sulfate kinase [Streptomyces fulvorobeus]NYE44098.1 adenylylsulfate kinase [Streptomyces fulvorobeus]GFN00606.1 adenylyl-sulfate kinase [Streptomyces fulvorobeus]
MRHPTAYCTCWPGATVWLTGLPSSGKSTIARALVHRLAPQGRRVEVLDGDENRARLTADLGFSREDRIANVRRIGLVAEVLARNGILTLVPVIAPYADARAAVRGNHERSGTPYLEIHVATPVEVCAERDVKGLYARQAAGDLVGLTGVDDPYEAPRAPDLAVPAHRQRPEESAALLFDLLSARGLA